MDGDGTAAREIEGDGGWRVRAECKLMQYSTTLLPSVNPIALGMFCGAQYTYHTFTTVKLGRNVYNTSFSD